MLFLLAISLAAGSRGFASASLNRGRIWIDGGKEVTAFVEKCRRPRHATLHSGAAMAAKGPFPVRTKQRYPLDRSLVTRPKEEDHAPPI
ncbi:MAG: hypothetical protein DMF04_12025 [Verrucomicrobia bacterium]|nr:MAG: hypothetical protein DMF04_12025 [Verrucomicrobiota bacterium]